MPAESLGAYKATAPWSNFFNIVGYNITGICSGAQNILSRDKFYIDVQGHVSPYAFDGLNLIQYSDGKIKKVVMHK